MSNVTKPFEIFRVSVPDGEYSRRADVVEKIHYDDAQSQLAALREELARMTEGRDGLRLALDEANKIIAWQRDEKPDLTRLADAERRNEMLTDLLRRTQSDGALTYEENLKLESDIDAALNPNPEASSHDE